MILERVKKTIKEYRLLEKKDRILIAYSGGKDSTALLHILLELRPEWQFELFLGHFNHKLRRNAEEDERFVRDMARKFSLPLFVGSENVRSQARTMKMNIEEAGRHLRYDFLKKTAGKIGPAKIATGHTMTDQAETFLMRLMRGSGLRGLAGIFPGVEGMLVRPLIQVQDRDIQAYLEAKNAQFRVDESNFDRRFLRNKIRLELLPFLERNFDPLIVSHLDRIASIIREEDSLLEAITQEKAKDVIKQEVESVYLDVRLLSSLPRALARRLVRNFIARLRGNLRAISFEDVESVLSMGEGKEFSLKKDMILRREKSHVFLKKTSPPRLSYEYTWDGEGILEIRELKMRFKGRRMRREKVSRLDYEDQTSAFLALEKIQFPLLIRNRREGDRYQPLGAPGQKKIKEIMRAKGVPLAERDRRPAFFSGGKIAWILGLPVGEEFKIEKTTTLVFNIIKL